MGYLHQIEQAASLRPYLHQAAHMQDQSADSPLNISQYTMHT